MIAKLIQIYRKHKEKILYLVFGGFTTVIYYIVFYVCNLNYVSFRDFHTHFGFGLSAWLSNIIAWVFAVVFAFITNKIIVFESKTKEKKAVTREVTGFAVARLISLGISTAITFVFIDWLGFNTFLQTFAVLAFVNVIVIVFNYFASKYFIFTQSSDQLNDE